VNNIVRNTIIGFTILCAIVLVFFCIELVILNRDGGNGGEPALSTNGSPADGNEDSADEPEPPDTELPTDTDLPEVTDQDEDAGSAVGNNQSPTGKQYVLPMFDDVHVIMLSASEELFDYIDEGDPHWTFNYKGGGKAALEIGSDYITPPGGVRTLAEEVMSGYLEGGTSSVGGERKIGNSPLRGFYASGDKNGETYEVWINGPFEGGDKGHAVVIVVNYNDKDQKDALYAVLDTLELLSEWP